MFFNKSYFWLELTDEEIRLLRVSNFGKRSRIVSSTVVPLKGDDPLKNAFEALGADHNPNNNQVRVLCNPKGAYAFLHSIDGQESHPEELVKIPQSVLHLEDPSSYLHFVLNVKNGEPYNPNASEKKWLFLGARKNVMEDINLKIRNIGATIKSIHWSLLSSIQGLLQHPSINTENITLLLLVGNESTWAAVLNGEEVLAIRNLTIGTKALSINFSHTNLESLKNDPQSIAALERFQREIETFIGFYELENALTIGSIFFSWPQEDTSLLSDYFKDTMGLKILSFDWEKMLHEKEILVDNKDSLIPLRNNGLGLISSVINS